MKSLNKIAASHIKNLYFFLLLTDDEENAEALHDFRVEYKKTRVFLRLAGFPKNKIKIPTAAKGFYEAAGRVRELQLQEQTMKVLADNAELPNYFTLLQKQKAFAITALKEKMTVFDIKKTFPPIIKKIPEKITAKHAHAFTANKAGVLLSVLEKKNKKDTDIHEIRKIIKDLMYSFHTLGSINLKFIIPLTVLEEKIFHELANDLGLFQDKCNALVLLRMSMFRNLPEEEKSVLKLIRANWMKEKQESRKKVLHKLLSASPLFITLTKPGSVK